jgi:hypothetical protein
MMAHQEKTIRRAGFERLGLLLVLILMGLVSMGANTPPTNPSGSSQPAAVTPQVIILTPRSYMPVVYANGVALGAYIVLATIAAFRILPFYRPTTICGPR